LDEKTSFPRWYTGDSDEEDRMIKKCDLDIRTLTAWAEDPETIQKDSEAIRSEIIRVAFLFAGVAASRMHEYKAHNANAVTTNTNTARQPARPLEEATTRKVTEFAVAQS
jgi:hypothetical protein